MNELRALVYTDESLRPLASLESLNNLLREAAAEAQAAGRLNIITLYGPDDDHLLLVVGSDETVMGFNHGHGGPPYYASKGVVDDDDPVLTAYVGLAHHTEFPRRWVIPMAVGEMAAAEFLATGRRPASIPWEEV
ncbi:hypothetical protein GCM10011487_06470 [Steroidobacter agaridevorans]|uniref:Immunity protein Imm1 n=1 Tax=Steroidobacter agaridevorans TaxID=2695856 RepID=A0A829Y604_9GAMM|nr:Imm1 family immunity protein [Steroidobacter agaridevorans]GFE78647.1 hypothetical protein GCM10011487_06470 [Steroidobacter agaridevorans]